MPKSSQNTILVIDDHLGARRSIEALLPQRTYKFLFADSGQAALSLLKSYTPDIILLDIMMPGMSGYEICRKIRENSKISEIPIIMITALDDEESMIEGIDSGADDFLSKPISKLELRARIRSILRLNRFRKLWDERQKFELVVAQSNQGYLIVDALGCIRFSNSAANRMLGFPDHAIESKNFFAAIEGNFSIQPRDVEDKFVKEDGTSPLEPFVLVRKGHDSKSTLWIRGSFQPLGLDHGTMQLLRLEDISDRIVSFQEKHTFSRMISHKLLTPLNAIKSAHKLFESDDFSPDRLASFVELQRSGIERLEYDIQSVLSFLGNERSPKHSISIAQAASKIESIAESVAFRFSPNCEYVYDLQETIHISPTGFEACIREIVENAIKFCHADEPTIDSYIKASEDGERIEIVFHNNSQPLTEEEVSNAWKPYWQADRYLTGEIPGMGLGLSLVAANVWAAGGSCTIGNCPKGLGVGLTLSFPRVQ